ncbi:MAG: tetraprenyl-beta-curcumene synthase family protein [Syntrophomonadaceae bacterium]|nr:tetraprenyl-beta-curcumene synthase family protein [Syntrophomonadaceae bacterium]
MPASSTVNTTRIPLYRGVADILLSDKILWKYIIGILPQVQKELRKWGEMAAQCHDLELRKQSLASLKSKAFHCQGGVVYAALYPGQESLLIRLITSYQTLCDYLDNLCDRVGVDSQAAFRLLHTSLFDAFTPGSRLRDYYALYPFKDDSGYLHSLVKECRWCTEQLPQFSMVHGRIMELIGLYVDLQVIKHLNWSIRERELKDWAFTHLSKYSDILWQEFAAASGSTLAIFALVGLASTNEARRDLAEQVINAYFPYICGLHILLDYFIDQEEDLKGGDLNFTFYYDNHLELLDRIRLFTREARQRIRGLPSAPLDELVINGLLAMYLSDKKVKEQGFQKDRSKLLNEAGRSAWRTYRTCSLVRLFL